MKKIAQFLQSKKLEKKTPLDEKSLYYVFERVVREEYGNRGIENLKVEYFRNRKLSIAAENSNWANEVSDNRSSLAEKINRDFGSREVEEILVK